MKQYHSYTPPARWDLAESEERLRREIFNADPILWADRWPELQRAGLEELREIRKDMLYNALQQREVNRAARRKEGGGNNGREARPEAHGTGTPAVR